MTADRPEWAAVSGRVARRGGTAGVGCSDRAALVQDLAQVPLGRAPPVLEFAKGFYRPTILGQTPNAKLIISPPMQAQRYFGRRWDQIG